MIVDPDVAITEWSLSQDGRKRALQFAGSGILGQVGEFRCSEEKKARETAHLLAAASGVPVLSDPALGENDRSSTGYLPPDQFEAAADAFFAEPSHSFRGWETAKAAQARILNAVHRIIAAAPSSDLAIVSHGAVGTILWCHLMGLPIDRRHDQPSQGHFWCADLSSLRPETGWRPIA